jgi:WD40 repeat protein
LPTARGPFFPRPGVLDLRGATAPWPSLLPALGHAGGITRLAVSRDGKWLAEASDDGRLLLRSLADPTQLVPLSDREGVQDLAFLPDRDALAVVHYQRAAIWDLATRKVVTETKADKDVAFGRLLAGGHRLAYDVHRRTIEIRSLDDGRRIETLARPCGPEMPGMDLVDLSGAGLCATYEREDKGVIRALRNGAPRARYKTRHGLAQAVAVSKDGKRALVSHHSGQVILVALDGPGRVMQLAPLDDVHTPALAFAPDGRRALTGSIDGVLRVWDAKTGALLDSLSMADRIDHPTSLAWAPDGRTLFVGTARGLIYRIEDGAK